MIGQLMLLFLAGIMIDFLVTWYTRSVSQKRVWSASWLSGVITFVNFILIAMIIKESSFNCLYNIVAYAGGNTIGTFVALIRDTV